MKRIASIDVFRALTMLLMLFVNDFWTLKKIPQWLKHSPADVDFLGFSDIIFPCFLFILGMAIPFAIEARKQRGDKDVDVVLHILTRSIALLIMGIFTVNYENYHPEVNFLPKALFGMLMTLGFFLIWNHYPKGAEDRNRLFFGLKVLGVVLLLYLAMIFRGTGNDSVEFTRLEPRWWGILGLIGWAYLGAALLYWLFYGREKILLIAWGVFTLMNISAHAGWLEDFPWLSSYVVGDGAFHSFAMAGVMGGLLVQKYRIKDDRTLFIRLAQLSLVMLVLGFLSHEFFIISKIKATPTWIFFCCSIGFGFFALLYFFADMMGKAPLFRIIQPAGDSTLTCYLIPYIYYNLGVLTGIGVPEMLKMGTFGLAKSMAYAFGIVLVTGLLSKKGIRLKI